MIGPELGLTQPGKTIVCGDSHTSTHGAFGALAIGIGTSEVEHVLATQTLAAAAPEDDAARVRRRAAAGLTAKDMILGAIGQVGVDGGVGYVVEYAGDAVRALSMEQRMTVCNMSIEWGARAGMVAPDETTFAYLEGRELAPKGARLGARTRRLAQLARDADATYDRHVTVDVAELVPQVTWGTNPGMVVPVTGSVPDPAVVRRPGRPQPPPSGRSPTWTCDPGSGSRRSRSTACSSARARTPASRTCARPRPGSSRAARVDPRVTALVVPGSANVRRQAEEEGLDRSSSTPASNGGSPAARCASE